MWFVRGLEDPRRGNSLVLASEQPGANCSENIYYQGKQKVVIATKMLHEKNAVKEGKQRTKDSDNSNTSHLKMIRDSVLYKTLRNATRKCHLCVDRNILAYIRLERISRNTQLL